MTAALIGRAVASDWSHCLKSGYDLLDLRWPTSALDSLGIDPDSLPEVVSPGSVLGKSSAAWHTATGLPMGTPVFAGMTDGCAAQLGAGTLGLGDWHTVVGTTLVVKGVSDHIVVDDTGAVYSHRAPHDGLWFPGGASSVGAGAVSALFADDDLNARTARISSTYTDRLTSIPLSYPLVTTAERFPVVRPGARGFVRSGGIEHPLTNAIATGIDADALFTSVLLGVACVERLAVETMSGAGVPVTGTFSSSGAARRMPGGPSCAPICSSVLYPCRSRRRAPSAWRSWRLGLPRPDLPSRCRRLPRECLWSAACSNPIPRGVISSTSATPSSVPTWS